MHLSARHVTILTVTQLRYLLGGGRGVRYLALFALVGFSVAFVVIQPVATLVEADSEAEVRALSAKVAPFVAWWIDAKGSSDPRIVTLLYERPSVLSAIFVILTGLMPLIASLGSGHHLAQEIAGRQLRFIALRSTRTCILVSRFLASVGLLSIASLLLLTALVVYVGLNVASVSMADAFSSGLQGWLALTVVGMPYVGLSVLVNVWVPVPSATRMVTLIIACSIPIALTRLAHEFDVADVVKLDPWAWKYHVLVPPPGEGLTAVLVFVGFTLVPLALAGWLFRRRSL